MSEPAIDKRKRKRGGPDSIAETLAKWKEINSKGGETRIRKAPAKGSKKGCMRGKGGPDNSCCNYRGVRQRTWGKWVAEIRAPNGGRRMWLGTFGTALEAAIAYDGAARAMYGACARVNLPECSSAAEVSITATSEESYDESTTTSSHNSFSNVSCPEAKVPNLGSGPPPSAAVVDAPCMVKADAEKDLSENSGHLELEDMFVNIGRRGEDDDRFGYIEVEALIEEFGHLEDEEFEDLPENMFNFDYMSRGTDSDLGKGTAGSECLDSGGHFGAVDISWPTLPPLQSWDEPGKLRRVELEPSSRLQSWDANELGNLCHLELEPTPPSCSHEFLGCTSMDPAYLWADCDFLRRFES